MTNKQIAEYITKALEKIIGHDDLNVGTMIELSAQWFTLDFSYWQPLTDKQLLEIRRNANLADNGDLHIIRILSDTGVAAARRRLEIVWGRTAVEYIFDPQVWRQKRAPKGPMMWTNPVEFDGTKDYLNG